MWVREGDLFADGVAVAQVGWARLALGEPHPDAFLRALEIATGLDNVGGIAFAFEGLAATAGTTGDVEAPERCSALRRASVRGPGSWTSASIAGTRRSSTRYSQATGRPTSRLRARRVTGCPDMRRWPSPSSPPARCRRRAPARWDIRRTAVTPCDRAPRRGIAPRAAARPRVAARAAPPVPRG